MMRSNQWKFLFCISKYSNNKEKVIYQSANEGYIVVSWHAFVKPQADAPVSSLLILIYPASLFYLKSLSNSHEHRINLHLTSRFDIYNSVCNNIYLTTGDEKLYNTNTHTDF